MSAVDRTFAELRAAGRKAFVPFVTAGDPDLPFTALLLSELARRGASLCEVGIPYSDPIADGPVIQASYTRALGRGIRLAAILEMLAQSTASLTAPVLTMVSYATVLRRSPARYLAEAQAAGVAGAIVPDLLVEESGELARLARQADFALVHLVTPTTPRERALRIAERSSGFLYYVSVTGITGERAALPQQLVDNVGWLREQTPLPICIGFGISRPEQVRLLAQVADGVIVGSAIVRRVGEATPGSSPQALQSIGQYVQTLIDALAMPQCERP